MKEAAGLMETRPMLEVLSTWSLEALAIVVAFALVVSGVIGLTQRRKR
jgi:hypothetical protein